MLSDISSPLSLDMARLALELAPPSIKRVCHVKRASMICLQIDQTWIRPQGKDPIFFRADACKGAIMLCRCKAEVASCISMCIPRERKLLLLKPLQSTMTNVSHCISSNRWHLNNYGDGLPASNTCRRSINVKHKTDRWHRKND